MIRRPPRSTLDRSSAASDVYKRQNHDTSVLIAEIFGNHDLVYENELFYVKKMNAGSTVSYTHLRAHETVLDLVCRLLLEKKKTTATEHHIKL